MTKLFVGVAIIGLAATFALAQPSVLTGPAAFGDWKQDKPGIERRFAPSDIPPPKTDTDKEKPDLNNHPNVIHPTSATPSAPPGFAVQLYASGLNRPRNIRIAPNGDVFVAESGAGRLLVFSATADQAGQVTPAVFAEGLTKPFGIAFYPAGPNPQWVYVAEPGRIMRFGYKTGATKAGSGPEIIIDHLPSEHHWTRDLAVAPDGQHLLVSIGSGSNVGGDTMPSISADQLHAFIAGNPLGAAWGGEAGRAQIRIFDPQGKTNETYATGIRNCVSMAIEPRSGNPWCVVNERDGLGDNTPPEYATHVRAGSFYGWPWFYIGDHQDPRWPDARPDLKGSVTVPDVLLQAHTAPLGISFYTSTQFPAEYRGDAFITMHGSWDRTVRSGYKVVRMRMQNGQPTGVVEDFLTGFVIDDTSVWGRPVGVAVAKDGALLVSEDGSNTIWRVTWKGR